MRPARSTSTAYSSTFGLGSATRGSYPAVEIAKLARDRLGLEQLRPGQEEAVRAVTAGRDTLVVMPTGSGKSAIYQLAALVLDGRPWSSRRSSPSSATRSRRSAPR